MRKYDAMSRKGEDYNSTANRAQIVAAPRGLVEEGLVVMERLIHFAGVFRRREATRVCPIRK